MDCPKCGVYNPEDRDNCWRCGAELPKQPEKPKRDPQAASRKWLYIGVVVLGLVTLLRMCGIQVPGTGGDASTGYLPSAFALASFVHLSWLI